MKKLILTLAPLIIISLLLLAGCAGAKVAAQSTPHTTIPQGVLHVATPTPSSPKASKSTVPLATSNPFTVTASPSSPSPRPSPTSSPPNTTIQPITLNFAHQLPNAYQVYFDSWAKTLEESSQGRVKIHYQMVSTEDKPETLLRNLKEGIVDIANIYPASYPDLFPINLGTSLPLLGQTNAKSGSLTPFNFMYKYGVVGEEWKDFKVLFFWSNPPLQLHTVNKLVKTPDDLRGLRISIERGFASYVEALGAIAVDIKSTEFAAAVARDSLDGVFAPNSNILLNADVSDIFPFHTQLNFVSSPWCVVMDLKKWNSLPPAIQNDLGVVCDNEGATLFYTPLGGLEQEAFSEIFNDKTQQTATLSSSELEAFKVVLKPVYEKWTSSLDTRGLDGRTILKELIKIANEACST